MQLLADTSVEANQLEYLLCSNPKLLKKQQDPPSALMEPRQSHKQFNKTVLRFLNCFHKATQILN